MKYFFLLLTFFCIKQNAFCQSVAQDFTKTDCNGVTHHLFADLDAGKCVFIEFAMMPDCPTCISAGRLMEKVKKNIKKDHPGKVEFYLMEWSGQKTCADIQSWAKTNSVTSTALPNGNTEIDYYGGIGMPTVVLIGGTDHKILWKRLGFASADTLTIKNKINAFFKSTGTTDEVSDLKLHIVPNPAKDQINLSIDNSSLEVATLEIVNLLGEKVGMQQWNAGTQNTFQIDNLTKGVYFVQLLDKSNGLICTKRFVKE